MGASSTELPTVAVFGFGGTIAMVPDGDGSGGLVPGTEASQLVQAVPALQDIAFVQSVGFRMVPGAHLTAQDVRDLVAAADARVRDGAHGIVVTQGTDTLEETAFLIDLLWGRPEPIVVTGAMRPPSQPGADGLAAVLTAGSPAAKEQGCLVVMNDEVHAARHVAKQHTTRPSAFGSPATGPLGWVAEGRPRLHMRVPPLPGCPLADQHGEPHAVGLLSIGFDSDPLLLRAARRVDYDAVVLEALGAGHLPAELVDDAEALAAIAPVVLASRAGAGEVLRATYAFPGSEQDLLRRGLWPAGWLSGRKARVLLLALLGAGLDGAELRARFAAIADQA